MKKVLVTGGAGFIGRAVVKALLERGDSVVVIDDLSRGNADLLYKDNPAVPDGTRLDVWNRSVIGRRFLDPTMRGQNPFDGVDQVIHLAAINGTKNFYERPDQVLSVAIRGMLNIVDACEKYRIKDLVVASSSEVYAEPEILPTSEDVPLVIPDVKNPRFSYSGGKIATELMTLHMASKCTQRAMIVRPHNIYGPNAGEDHVIPTIMRYYLEGKKEIPIQGSGQETRSFCYIDDCVSGILTVLDRGAAGEIYHIGHGPEVTIYELVRFIGGIFKASPVSITGSPLVPGSPSRRCPDVSKLKGLGWEAQVDLLAGLHRIKESLNVS